MQEEQLDSELLRKAQSRVWALEIQFVQGVREKVRTDASCG